MAARKTRTREETAAARNNVLRAALEIASERGYDGATIALVAAAAGESESFVFWHFRNKDALLAEALEFGYRGGFGSGLMWTDPVTPQTRLESLRSNFELVGPPQFASGPYWKLGLTLALEERPVEPAARARFLDVRADAHEVMRRWWAAALDPRVIATMPAVDMVMAQLSLAALDGLAMARATDGVDHRPPLDPMTMRQMVIAGLHAVALALESGSHHVDGSAPASRPKRSGIIADAAADDARNAFLNAAEVATAAGGLEMATVSRICELAGLPVSSFYWWFDDKESLINAVIDRVHSRWRARRAPLPNADSAELYPVLVELERGLLEAHEIEPTMLRISCMLLLTRDPNTTSVARTAVAGLRAAVADELLEWFERALRIEPGDARQRLASDMSRLNQLMVDGLFFAGQIDDDARPLPDFAWMLATMLQASASVSASDSELHRHPSARSR